MSASTSNTKDSAGRRLGLKKTGGQEVLKGDIIVFFIILIKVYYNSIGIFSNCK